MAIFSFLPATSKRRSIVPSMTGSSTNFIAPQAQASLPPNYTFDDLARYEEERRKELIPQFEQRIGGLRTGIESQFGDTLNRFRTTTAGRRSALSSSLSDTANKQFQLQNPALLEDLHSRGLFTSPTEVARSQAQVQKELALENERRLGDFDAGTRTFEDTLESQRLQELSDLDKAKTLAGMQLEQDALDSALDLRRGQLESSLQQQQAAQEQALAESLAKQQGKQGITQSLIGAGGGILGGLIGGGGGGLLSGLPLFGGATAAGPATAAGVGPAGAGGVGVLPGLGLLAAGGIGASLASRMGEKVGGTAGGIIGNPIGYQINKAKQIISNPKQVAQKAVSSVSKSIKKAFCFDGETPIEMDDGSMRAISRLYVGAETKGGRVVSIRVSETDPGTRFNYKGIYVTGSHAVYEEGKWIRVKESPHANPISGSGIVWSVATTDHRIHTNGLLFADELETDDYEELTIDQSLARLNEGDRQEYLMEVNGNGL